MRAQPPASLLFSQSLPASRHRPPRYRLNAGKLAAAADLHGHVSHRVREPALAPKPLREHVVDARSASADSVRAPTDGPGKLGFNEDVTESRWKRLRRRYTVDHDTSSAAAVLVCCRVVPRSPRVRSTLAMRAVRSSLSRRCAIYR